MKNIILVITFFMSISLWSQELNYQLKGRITNQDLGSNEGGVTVSMLHNGSVVSTTKTSSNGKYSLDATGPKTGTWEIVYSKPGMVTKKISFDGSKMNEEDIPAGNQIPFPALDMDLFAERENVDFSFLNTEYVASFYWNTRKFALDFDRVASEKVRKKINDLLLKAEKEKSENDVKYQNAIKKADLAFTQKNYEEALANYEEALGYKPTEQYPADKIVELDALIQAQKEAALIEEQANSEYNNLISAGDNLRDQGNLEGAVSKYKEALTKKQEQYPKDQINALNAQIEAEKKELENQAAYEEAIKKGDMFLKQNSLKAARDKYNEAIALKPSEQYPKDKLKEIEDKSKAQEELAAKKKKYEDALAAADVFFDADNYEDALAKYQEALTFESSATYPKERLKICQTKIEAAKAAANKAEQVAQLLKDGDKELTAKNYDVAKSKFNEVLTLDAANSIAVEKLALIEQKMLAEAAEIEKKKEFDKLVSEGDSFVSSEKYEDGIAKYQEALALSSSPEVEGKLEKAKNALAAKNKADEQVEKYQAAVDAGNALMVSGNLDDAKAKFELAATIDPSQTLPKEKINEIKSLMLDQKAEAERKAKYNDAVTQADHHFNNAQWTEALQRYREAASINDGAASIIDSGNPHVQNRIAEIETIIQKEKEEAAQKENVAKLIADGKTLKNSKKLEEAKGKFEEVLAIDANNTIALAEIDNINQQLAAMKSASEKEEAFEQLKTEGFELANQEKYQAAKSKLQEALTLKDDAAVRNKIIDLEKKLADLDKQKSIDDKYNSLLEEAAGIEANNINGAIAKYEQASKIKPNESLPKEKIAELKERLLADVENEKVNAAYTAAMKRGDDLMAQEEYLAAIKEYNVAITIKPGEQEPVDKAAEAERLEKEKGQEVDAQYEKILTVAEKKMNEGDYDRAVELVKRAMNLSPSDPRPKVLLEKIEEKKALDLAYEKVMTEAAGLANLKKYVAAKAKYNEALNLKPTESLPQEKIVELEALIDAMASSAQTEKLYNDYMTNGKNHQIDENYAKSLSEYQNALSVKPGDVPAQNKINEIQQILDDIANAKAANMNKVNQFNELVSQADVLFSGETYLDAKNLYEEAMVIDASSTYVKQQIEECIRLAREKGNAEAEKEYRKIIAAADKNFNSATYDKAKSYYQRALKFKSDDPYPKQKLAEIEAIINPTTIASVELEDLGDPFENSIMDGAALLEKADAERKLIKGTKLKSEIDDIYNAESDLTREKTQDHYDNSNEIYQVQMNISRDEGEADLGRQATIDALRASEFERQNAETNNMNYEHAQSIGTQDALYIINDEVSLEYGERQEVYFDNANIMESYNVVQAERIRQEIESDKLENVSADQELTIVKLQIDEGVRDDYDDRAEIRAEVVEAEKFAFDVHKTRSDETHDKALGNKNVVRKVELAYDQRSVEDAHKAADNNEELKVVRDEVVDAEVVRTGVETAHAYRTDSEIAGVKELVSVEQQGMDENRKASVEIIKQGNKELADAHYNEYNDELVKYITNKEKIKNEVEINNGISEKAEIAHDKKVAYVERMDKKANTDIVDGSISDEEERLNARSSIETIYAGVQESANEEVKKVEENVTTLNDMTKTIEADKTNQAIGEQDKHYETSAAINKVDDSPGAKVIVANELGEEYPEGVSQESFTQTDENGLMTAIITRRIVVIESHANIYVRTQTLHGITYSKNGKPSLGHVWNKETQDPSLERHY